MNPILASMMFGGSGSGSGGGDGGVLVLTPPDHTIINVSATQDKVYLCPTSAIMGAIDQNTGAMTKPIFINVPYIDAIGGSEWYEWYELVFANTVDQLMGSKVLTSIRSIDVIIQSGETDVYLAYTSGK